MDLETSQDDAPLLVEKPPRTAGLFGTVLASLTVVLWFGIVLVAYLGATVRTPPAFLTGAVMVLPYLLGVYIAWTFFIWILAPDRKSIPVALALGLATFAILWGPSWPSWSHSGSGPTLVVMEWNVERLWGEPLDGSSARDCITAAVDENQPDLISFLEVSRLELETLSSVLGLQCVQEDYLGSGVESRGGLALCVRGSRWRLKNGEPQAYLDRDQWKYVLAELETEGAKVNALAVHLRPYAFGPHSIQKSVLDFASGNPGPLQALHAKGVKVAKSQGGHAQALLERVERFRDPTVLAGDFNSTRDMALHYRLRERLVDSFERGGRGIGPTTYVGGWLPLRVDFIYATPAIEVVASEVLERDCSDHRPIVSELTVPLALH